VTATQPAPARLAWPDRVHPGFRISLRWLYIGVLTLIAFHSTIANLVQVTRAGSIGSYVWTVPAAGILAAVAVARRERTELPIHDRQTDVILGGMGLVLALLLHGVLLQRYALYFYLLRLDLVAMWMFVISSSVVLFGLRPMFRFVRVWALLMMVFPLPYYIAVILLGGTQTAAAVATLLIAGTATGIAVGRSRRRGYLGGIAAWGVGLSVLFLMRVFFPNAPFTAYVQIPALSAIVSVGLLLFFYARRGAPKRVLDRKVESLAARQVYAGAPLVFVVAIALAFVPLPAATSPPPTQMPTLTFGSALASPADWHSTDVQTYLWVQRLHGPGAHLIRQTMTADKGNPQWDKMARPRTVVVDSLTTFRPFSLNVYPAKVLYSVEQSRLSKPRRVDLGHGITGELVSVVDDNLLVTWNMVQWSWRNADTAQRVLVIAVDNHDDNAPFPKPSGALLPTLNTLFTVLFRGNSAVADRDPTFKDAAVLTQFSRGLIEAQLGDAP
jgi:hypothetical protein